MIFSFFAVITVGQILLMVIRQCNSGSGRQRNTFICRAKYDVKRDAGSGNRRCIKTTQIGKGSTGLKLTGVEKIRTGTARLERKFTKTQRLMLNRQLNKVVLILFHAKFLNMI